MRLLVFVHFQTHQNQLAGGGLLFQVREKHPFLEAHVFLHQVLQGIEQVADVVAVQVQVGHQAADQVVVLLHPKAHGVGL